MANDNIMPKAIDLLPTEPTLYRIETFEPVGPHSIANGVDRLFFDAMEGLRALEDGSMTEVYEKAAIQNDELYLNNYNGYEINVDNAVYTICTIAINERNETAYSVFADDGNTNAWYTVR